MKIQNEHIYIIYIIKLDGIKIEEISSRHNFERFRSMKSFPLKRPFIYPDTLLKINFV